MIRRPRRRLLLVLLLLAALSTVIAAALVAADWWTVLPEGETADYVGRQKCAECHEQEIKDWTGSDHDRAMEPATPETVLGDFNDQEYTQFALEEIDRLDGDDFQAVVREAKPADWSLVLPGFPKKLRDRVLDALEPLQREQVEEAMASPIPVRPCDVVVARQEIGDVVRRLKRSGRIRVDFGLTSKMFRRGDEFFITTEGPDGKLGTYQIKYTFGVRPLQQYLVEFPNGAELKNGSDLPKGSVQCLRLTWDSVRNRWYNQYPGESIPAGDELHWTGPQQTWNYMCADCHSTNLQKNYDLETNTYHTTWSEIDVSCETCHGPGSLHVKLAESKSLFWDRRYRYGLPNLKSSDSHVQIETCAPCHARRRVVYPSPASDCPVHLDGPKLLDRYVPELFDNASPYLANRSLYYADGQILEEDYVYGSFIQSKMYAKGIRCTDCHDPHTARVKTEDSTDNTLCTSCHTNAHPSGKYDAVAHHHHPDASKPGTRCVECHMPETLYMGVDPRRDHSMRIPRPDLTVSLGIPNACNGCHHDLAKGETPEWAAEKVREWYGDRKGEKHFAYAIAAGRARQPGGAQALLSVLRRKDTNAMVRASSLRLLADYHNDTSRSGMLMGLEDPEPLVRTTALETLGGFSQEEMIQRAGPRLFDPLRAVRVEAARALSPVPTRRMNRKDQEAFDAALKEYFTGMQSLADRGAVHYSMALVYDNLGRVDRAEQEYRIAVRMEPSFLPARNNLGMLYSRRGRQALAAAEQLAAEARQAAALGQESLVRQRQAAAARQQEIYKKQMALAEKQFLAAVAINPDFVEVRDNLARLYYGQGKLKEAEEQFRKIIELQPKLAEPHFSLGLMLAEDPERQRESAEALAAAARLAPNNARIRYNYGLALRNLGRLDAAVHELKAAVQLAPSAPGGSDQRADYLYALVDLYAKEQRWSEAAETAQRLVDMRPGVPQFRTLLEQARAKAAERKPE